MADWNYKADLDLAKDGLSRISDPDKARNLVKALLGLIIQNSTLESGSISDSFPEQGSDEFQDEYPNPLDWNYAADFIQRLMGNMPKLTRKTREQIQHLMSTCLTLAEESEVVDPIDVLNSSLAEELNITESQVISHPRPFEIPELFHKILSYCPLDTLLTCRLINQYWNQNSVHWIHEKKKRSVFMKSDNFPKFWNIFENTEMLPLTKFFLYLGELSLDQVTKFLTKHGSSIRGLGLFFRRGSQDNILVLKKLQLVLKHVPNLRYLHLFEYKDGWELFPELSNIEEEVVVILPRVESLDLCFDSRHSFTEKFLDGFLTMFPNVGTFNVGGIGDAQDWKQFWTSMPNNVHTAEIWFQTPGIWIEMTENRSLKLKNVSMQMSMNLFTAGNGNNNQLEILLNAQSEFLWSQSENLEDLSLNVSGPFRRQFRIQLPVMKNLESAIFIYSTDYSDREGNPIVPLQPEQLSKLKHLCLSPQTIRSGLFADSLFPSVQEVNFYNFNLDEDHPSVLPQIVAKFPNLKKVTNIHFKDVGTMERIFTNLGSIEDLELKILDNDGTTKNVNLALSGFPVQAEPKCILTQLADCVGYESLPLWIEPPRPSLRDLTNLKRLVLEFDSKTRDESARVRIDEFAVYMTFLRISPEIRLILKGGFLISDKLAGKLTAHYRNVYFMPSNYSIGGGG